MVSNTGSDGRSQTRPPQSSSDGRGGEVAETLGTSGPRYIYYRLYTTEGPIRSNNPIYANNPFISRTLPRLITPPRTASSVKKHICKIEGLSGAKSSMLFESLSSPSAAAESSKLAVKEDCGLGFSKDDPIVLVVGVEDIKNRKANATQLVGLPEALPFEPRYVHYYLYDEEGAMTSKTAFNTDDSFLGRIDTLSIAPPQTLASLRSQVMKAEGIVNQNIQLFEDVDGEVPMNDNDAHISFQTEAYPGHDEDHPVTIVYSQQSRGEVKEAQNTNQVDPSFSKQIRGAANWDPDKIHQADWLPFKLNEIMYTDGVKTTRYIAGLNTSYSGYIAVNSAGQKGFVYESHIRFL